MKVLLIDDSRTMRAIQRKILQSLGYEEIAEANDGVEGLSQVVAEEPELILVDWNMPNMDGLTFVRKLREARKDIPIIMVTTEAERSANRIVRYGTIANASSRISLWIRQMREQLKWRRK